MASYLSYFTSNSSSAPPQQQYNQGQPATSTWSNTFSSRIATLRKALTKDSEDDDPDNEDCSHVSNVLRAYYAQKGRPLPEWLPPDPKKPVVQPVQPQYGQYGGGHGDLYAGQTHNRTSSGGRGGLSDLWDSNPSQAAAAAPAQSLRSPRPTPQSMRSSDGSMRDGTGNPYSSSGPQQHLAVRPLPSQRAGSFQNTPAAAAATAAVAAPTVASGRDRLRARLQGGGGSGRNSPGPTQPSFGSSEETNAYGRSDGQGANAPYTSASEPWAHNGYNGTSGRDLGAGVNSRGFGNPAYRSKPGGPR